MSEQLRIRLPDTALSAEEFKHECALRVPRVINALLQIVENEDNQPQARVSAGVKLMEYAYGRPRQEIEHSGDNQPLKVMIRHFTESVDDKDKPA